MRRRLSDQQYSKQAYFFGITSLILFLVQGGLSWTKAISDRNNTQNLPMILMWLTLLLLLFTASFCIVSAIRSRNEPKSFKQRLGWILALGCAIFMVRSMVAAFGTFIE